jgi:hypothetical protein
MNKATILLTFLILGGSLFAANLTAISKDDVSPPTKIANYSYQTKLKNGTVISIDTVANKIDSKTNTLLDCPGMTCDYKVEVDAKTALTFDAETFKGAYIGEGVTVERIFYETTTSTTKETCDTSIDNKTSKETTTCKNTTTTTTTENTDILKPFAKNENRTYIIRFKKDNTIDIYGKPKYNNRVVDVYHIIYGQERKDAAIWNSSGATVTTDGLYTVVKFTANGTFNVTEEINATVLVVAGGASGGFKGSGGGGAGGLIYNTSYNATGNITVVIGTGGEGATTDGQTGTRGGNSSFGSLEANGGGSGGHGGDGGIGGSGGGAGYNTVNNGGVATPAGQGYAGGDCDNCNQAAGGYPGGGGGGAGGLGQNGSASVGGNGGIGINYTINGSTVCYAGGGGASGATPGNATCGGSGGSTVNGANPSAGTNGTGGGGGAGGSTKSGTGGSGVVIIRFLTPKEPTNITCYAQTETPQYNGTMMNYTFTGIFINPTASSQTVNLSVTANGTVVATNNSVAIAANSFATLTGNWTASRGTLDTNFTIVANATGSNQAVLNGSSTSSIIMILPIDPPSAINLMNNGGKTRCRTPNTIGYWDRRDWNINASWNCNYTNENLTTQFGQATTSSALCYQETANVATACGGLATGTYLTPDDPVDGCYSCWQYVDGDWDTSANNYVYSMYVNYSKPASATNLSKWQVKSPNVPSGSKTVNYTLNTCWNVNPLQFKSTISSSSQTSLSCYNGTTWVVLESASGFSNMLYEEAMWWNVDTNGIKFVDSGNTTFSNSNVTTSYFDRLAGDIGTAATFIFNQISSLLIR